MRMLSESAKAAGDLSEGKTSLLHQFPFQLLFNQLNPYQLAALPGYQLGACSPNPNVHTPAMQQLFPFTDSRQQSQMAFALARARGIQRPAAKTNTAQKQTKHTPTKVKNE